MSERLVQLVDPKAGETVLDLAAGPGDTGFLAAPYLAPDGRLLSTDVAPEMVDAARRRAAELGITGVEFSVEDGAALSFGDASIDGVLCRWGLMLIPDMAAAASEVARVLRPDGRAAFAVWADPSANDWITAPSRSALALGLIERPDPHAPGPFRLSAEGRLAEVLDGARLSVDVVEDVRLTWRAPSLDEWWEVVCDTSRMLVELLGRLEHDDAEGVRAGAQSLLGQYVAADGSVAVPGLARVALATRR